MMQSNPLQSRHVEEGGSRAYRRLMDGRRLVNDTTQRRRRFFLATTFLLMIFSWTNAQSQEKIRVSYSSTDTLNSLWTIAGDAGFYKKHGLDADVVYIGSSTTTISAI